MSGIEGGDMTLEGRWHRDPRFAWEEVVVMRIVDTAHASYRGSGCRDYRTGGAVV